MIFNMVYWVYVFKWSYVSTTYPMKPEIDLSIIR